LDYELFFQAQQGSKNAALFAGQFNALVSPHQGQLYKKRVTYKITKACGFTGVWKHQYCTQQRLISIRVLSIPRYSMNGKT
jgi:hypothetical protein